jgi:phosphatidylethanolamine/phosphatidyl-N-methylethanolamine N-methyltransferase
MSSPPTPPTSSPTVESQAAEPRKVNSWLFLKRFLRQPTKVASVIPSSSALIRHVARKFDFSRPRVIVELGPGEGCHTREILRRMHPDSRLILFELDEALVRHLREQFAGDRRVDVLHRDARDLTGELARLGISHCDYVLSGIPFSILDRQVKRQLLKEIHACLEPDGKFIIYQVTNELLRNAKEFPRAETEHCMLNIPPMFVIVFHKDGTSLNGSADILARTASSPEPAEVGE